MQLADSTGGARGLHRSFSAKKTAPQDDTGLRRERDAGQRAVPDFAAIATSNPAGKCRPCTNAERKMQG